MQCKRPQMLQNKGVPEQPNDGNDAHCWKFPSSTVPGIPGINFPLFHYNFPENLRYMTSAPRSFVGSQCPPVCYWPTSISCRRGGGHGQVQVPHPCFPRRLRGPCRPWPSQLRGPRRTLCAAQGPPTRGQPAAVAGTEGAQIWRTPGLGLGLDCPR